MDKTTLVDFLKSNFEVADDDTSAEIVAERLMGLMEKVHTLGYRKGWEDCGSSTFGDSSWDPPVALLRSMKEIESVE